MVFSFGSLFLFEARPAEPKRTILLHLRIDEKGMSELKSAKFNFVTGILDGAAWLTVTEAEMDMLSERGFQFEKVMESSDEPKLYMRALYGEDLLLDAPYHTYEEILAAVDSLTTTHPNLIQRVNLGKTTQDQRDIWAVKISDHVAIEEDEPAILLNGVHHGDEINGAEICLELIRKLVKGYAEDERVTGWVNDYEIWLVPVLNVDGHHRVTRCIDPRWRKNARDLNGDGVIEFGEGVDLNRNYDFNWALGGTDEPLNERYRGPYPFSESESRAIGTLAEEQRFLLSLTYHSQGEVVYYPWDWHGRHAPDDRLLTEIARGIAASIKTMKGDTTYRAEYGAGTVGQTYTWFYGRYGTFDFVVETGKGAHIFPGSKVRGIVENNLRAVYYLLDRARGPGLTGHVLDAKTRKPLEAIVWFPDIESDELERRRSEPKFGRYWRLLQPGSYRVIVYKQGYETKVVRDIAVKNLGWTELEVELNPIRSRGR